jgi:hypothetical protein
MTLTTISHEIVDVFGQAHIPLSDTLVEMLNEHYSHRTERRGCGYTQATRVLSTYINQRHDPENFESLRIFNRPTKSLKLLIAQAISEDMCLDNWHNLDLRPDLKALLANPERVATNPIFFEMLSEVICFQQTLRQISEQLTREESQLLVQLISDIILPKDAANEGLINLSSLAEKPKVGSCTMAEKFFLEIVYGAIPRKGRVNILTDDNGLPVLIEKLNMGDSHSCISVRPLMMNGVRLPIGSLLAVNYDADLPQQRPCKQYKGQVIPISLCTGFWFLRLTTLSVSPAHRARAFTSHFDSQSAAGLFSHHSTDIRQLLAIADAQR